MIGSPHLKQGALVAGRWQVSQFLGHGDLGEVYEAIDSGGGKMCALKLYAAPVVGASAAWTEFERIARAVSMLPFDTIARVTDFGIDPKLGAAFSVGERVLWPSLDEEVRRSGPLAPKHVAAILELIAPALDAAHAAGIVHRELTPSNLFAAKHVVTGARITDFGVSVLRSAIAMAPGWAGPPGWTAPDGVDRAAPPSAGMDVYAIGAIVFFLLTGRSAFRSMQSGPPDPNALWNEIILPLPPASERARELGASLPPELDKWFAHTLVPHPKARFSTVAEASREFSSRLGVPAGRAAAPAAQQAAKPALGISKKTMLGMGVGEATPPPLPASAAAPAAGAPRAAAPAAAAPAPGKLGKGTQLGLGVPPGIFDNPAPGPADAAIPAPPNAIQMSHAPVSPTAPTDPAGARGPQPGAFGQTLPIAMMSPIAPKQARPLGGTMPMMDPDAVAKGSPGAPARPGGTMPILPDAGGVPNAEPGAHRASSPSVSDSGPVAIASPQPLAYMGDLPRTNSQYTGPHAAYGVPAAAPAQAPTVAGLPRKTSLLVPLAIAGALFIVAIVGIVGWFVVSRGGRVEPAAPSAVATPVVSTTPPPEAPTAAATESAAVETAPAESASAAPSEPAPEPPAPKAAAEPPAEKPKAEKPPPVEAKPAKPPAEAPPKESPSTGTAAKPDKSKKPCGTFINPCK
jgi:eukaryotic-like serine/threonine-protein kinase